MAARGCEGQMFYGYGLYDLNCRSLLMMDFSSRHMMIPPESIKKEILEDSSQEALLSIQKVPSLSDLSKENSLGRNFVLKRKVFSHAFVCWELQLGIQGVRA
ncbi:hypothetical protein TNIN_128071 [Trichonephila inaurata madagascariensis]|uniref:Uncharacterized protein n=1 Tax=Trichonephila inaurata madagascariensis TaxID=2747483 RepID=A0A8X6I6E1_9ARAC|nr:hypothetical protein TNIN_128071 [Trichonephila inaurata madagascariensis]